MQQLKTLRERNRAYKSTRVTYGPGAGCKPGSLARVGHKVKSTSFKRSAWRVGGKRRFARGCEAVWLIPSQDFGYTERCACTRFSAPLRQRAVPTSTRTQARADTRTHTVHWARRSSNKVPGFLNVFIVLSNSVRVRHSQDLRSYLIYQTAVNIGPRFVLRPSPVLHISIHNTDKILYRCTSFYTRAVHVFCFFFSFLRSYFSWLLTG